MKSRKTEEQGFQEEIGCVVLRHHCRRDGVARALAKCSKPFPQYVHETDANTHTGIPRKVTDSC